MAQQFPILRVKGYREVTRALNRVDKATKRSVQAALKDAAQPIADAAKQKIGRYQGASLGTIRPRAVTGGVFVTQTARKRTGKRSDFGALQMRVGLVPALEENSDGIEERVGDALGALIRREGF